MNLFLIILSLFSQSILINLEKAANYLKKNAQRKTTGYCARYVTNALYEAGFIFERPDCAHLYWDDHILNQIGYIEINNPNSYIIGDITVTENNTEHIYGHIAMWCGEKWISDFIQNSEFVYISNQPPIHYYRYQNTSKTVLTSYNACDNANSDQCSSINVEEREFQNWKCEKVNNACTYVPKNSETKKIFEKIVKGEDKEIAAANYEKFLDNSYGSFSQEDTDIINRKNTCSYISFGNFKSSESSSTKYNGVSDKNLCFNAEQFSDLKGLVNCGYAEVLIKINGQNKNINLCSYVPTKDVNEDLIPYIKYRFIDKITMDELEEIIEDGKLGRMLDENELSYEITIEDKNGRKVKFSDQNYDIQLVSLEKESLEENSLKIKEEEEENPQKSSSKEEHPQESSSKTDDNLSKIVFPTKWFILLTLFGYL